VAWRGGVSGIGMSFFLLCFDWGQVNESHDLTYIYCLCWLVKLVFLVFLCSIAAFFEILLFSFSEYFVYWSFCDGGLVLVLGY
jgi:hypothetical protein